MKKTTLYALVVLVIVVIAVAGWYYYSYTAQYIGYNPTCPSWKCTQIVQTSTCPNGTTNYTCSPSGFLTCNVCIMNYTRKNYLITQIAFGYQNISGNVTPSGVFTVNNETFQIAQGKTHTLSDEIIFGVTTLNPNYTAFYLQSPYDNKSSSLLAPFPASTTVNLIISQSQNCVPTSRTCPGTSTASCSGNTQICTAISYICGGDKPVGCVAGGRCSGACPV